MLNLRLLGSFKVLSISLVMLGNTLSGDCKSTETESNAPINVKPAWGGGGGIRRDFDRSALARGL